MRTGLTIAATLAAALVAAPAAGQTLNFMMNLDAPHYDPHRTSAGTTANILFLLGDTLTTIDFDLQTVKPHLAKSWTVSDDGKLYTFELREDVSFCSGKKMTADDVVYSFRRAVDPEVRSPFRWRMGKVKEIRATGPYTVEYELEEPYNDLPLQLANYQGTIINQEVVEELGKDFGVAGFDGTGPYCWESWEPRSQLSMRRHDAYTWGPSFYENQGPAKFERQVMRIVPEESARIAAMASGQMDYSYTMPDQSLAMMEKAPNVSVYRPVANQRLFYLGFKITRDNVADKRVRTALSQAIDRDQIVQSIYFGNAEPAYGFIHPSALDFSPDAPQHLGKYDPEGAAKLLDEAGWTMGPDGFRQKDGQRLELQLYGFAAGRSPKVAEAVQGFWRRIGVDLQLQMWDGTIVFSKLAQQDYDIWSIAFPYSSAGDALRLYFHSTNVPTPNRMNWKDPETDRLLDAALATNDPAEKAKLLAEVQTIVQDNALWVPLVHEGLVMVANAKIKNVKAHAFYTSLAYKTLDWSF
ncbi:MAG: ABC transporter substrate-binding protein [Alphaproteobacteria bacterium]